MRASLQRSKIMATRNADDDGVRRSSSAEGMYLVIFPPHKSVLLSKSHTNRIHSNHHLPYNISNLTTFLKVIIIAIATKLSMLFYTRDIKTLRECTHTELV